MKGFTAVDLFAGGFALGSRHAGFDHRLLVDNGRNSVANMDLHSIRPDLLVSGHPRGETVLEFMRAVREMFPRVFVWAGSTSLTTYEGGAFLPRLTEHYGGLGYRVKARELNPAHYGVPTRRKVLCFIGVRKGLPGDVSWPEPSEIRYTPPDVLRAGELYDTDCPSSPVGEVPRKVAWVSVPLTVREHARLQAFPDDYLFSGSVAAQHDQIGNAVPVRLARAISNQVASYLKTLETRQ